MQTQPHNASIVRLHSTEGEPDGSAALRASVASTLGALLADPPSIELTSSCTHALEAAGAALDLGPGDEIIVPAFTFPSTANAFLLRGATIRFADIDPRTGNIDPASVERCGSSATAAVVCMHYGGISCDMDPIVEQCSSGGWSLIEDAAHGMFASYDGVPLGRLGVVGALSFHRTKNVSAIDGGALVVNDPSMVERTQIALDKGTNRAAFEAGRVASYEWSGPGSSWRMSEPLLAAFAEQLRQAPSMQARRHEVWDRYATELGPWAELHGVALPYVPPRAHHPAHLFWMTLPSSSTRDRFTDWCAAQGVEAVRHFGSLPESTFGRTIVSPPDACPHAEAFASTVVRLPLHHQLSESDVERVLHAVTSFR